MSRELVIPARVDTYAEEHSTREPELFRRLAAETREAFGEEGSMLLGHLGGAFLQMLVRVSGARRVLEIGTFTGYSTLWMAEGLPDDGVVVTCDREERGFAIARRYWAESAHGHKIRTLSGDAAVTVPALDGGPFDLVFLDAEKEDYVAHWELVLPRVRRGGIVVADNTFWYGAVFDPREASDRGVVEFNRRVRDDARVRAVLLTVRDGLTVAVVE